MRGVRVYMKDGSKHEFHHGTSGRFNDPLIVSYKGVFVIIDDGRKSQKTSFPAADISRVEEDEHR